MNAKRFLVSLFVGVAALVTQNLANAQTNKTWTGSANTDWFNGSNWSPAGVPGSNDIVNIAAGAGTINLTAAVVLNNQFNWAGGTLIGKSLTLSSAAVGTINGSSSVYVGNSFTNLGTVNWSGSVTITVYNDNSTFFGVIQNGSGATWNMLSDATVNTGYSSAYAFNNAGTVVKSPTTGTTTFNIPFNNTGTLSNFSGTINLNGGGTIGGTINSASGRSINFNSGNFNGLASTVVSGLGKVQFSGGNLSLSNDIVANLQLTGGNINLGPLFQGGAITNLTLAGSTLTGTNTVSGTMNWTAGILGGPLTVAQSGILNISSNTTVYVYNSLITAGTVNWTGSTITVYNDNSTFFGQIQNQANGVWNIQCDASVNTGYSGPYSFSNAGSIIKSIATGNTTFNLPFLNSGNVTNQSGTFYFNNGGTIGGTFFAATNHFINFNSGTFTGLATGSATGPGVVQFSGGTLNLPADLVANLSLTGGSINLGAGFQGGTITNLPLAGSTLTGTNTVTGVMNWTAGALFGPVTVAHGGVLNIAGSGTVYVQNSLITAGTVNWTGSTITVYNDNSTFFGQIQNQANGAWNIQCDASVNTGYSGPYSFNNAGAIIKSVTSGNTTFNLPFINSGNVTNLSGNFIFNGGGTIGGTFYAATNHFINFNSGTFTGLATGSAAGPGVVQFVGGTLNLPTDLVHNLSLTGGSINLGAGFQGGTITNMPLAGSILNGTNILTGIMNWTGGALNGPFTIATNGTMNISGSGTVYVYRPLTNGGTVNWTGETITIYNDTSTFLGMIQNAQGGLWNIQCDASVNSGYSGPFVFNNAGALIKSVTTGTTTFNVPFNGSATGTVTNSSGTINFNAGGTIAGAFGAAVGKFVNFNGGHFNGVSTTVVGGAGTVQFDSGSLTLSNDIIANLQLTGGTVSLGTNFQSGSITNLTLAGSELLGTNVVSGNLNLTAGVIGGPTTIANTGTLNITGSGTVYLYSPLTNAGTVNWFGQNFTVYSDNSSYFGSVQNLASGTWNIQCDQSMNTGYSGPFLFNNAGSVVKSITTGTTTFNLPFNNTGTVTNLSGTINFSSGGSIGGTYNVAAGKVITFNGGNFTSAGALMTGAGTAQLNGGTLTLQNDYIPNLQLNNGAVTLGTNFQGGTITNLTLIGSSLNGSNVVTGTFNCGNGFSGQLLIAAGGTMNWSGGSGGLLNVSSNAVLNITGGSVFLYRQLTNAGTVNWLSGAVYVYDDNNTYFGGIQNLTNALWSIQCDQSLNAGYSFPYFNNLGSVVKSVTTGGTTIGIPFTNAATVTNLTGTITFNGGGMISGTYNTSSNAVINFGGSAYSTTGASISGAGIVQMYGGSLLLVSNTVPNLLFTAGPLMLGTNFQGGTITNLTIGGSVLNTTNTVTGVLNCGNGFNGNLLIAGGATMNWSGGSAGVLTVANNAVLNLTGGSDFLYQPLTNSGTVNWLSGTVYIYNDNSGYLGKFQNQPGALFSIQCDQSINAGYNFPYFNNLGSVVKSVTTGTSSFGVTFTNIGTVTNLSGTITFSGSGPISGTYNVAAGKTINFTGSADITTGASISGAGTVQLNGGSLQLVNDIVPNLLFTSGNVSLGSNFQGGTITNLTLVGSVLTGTNTVTGVLNAGNGFSGSLLVAAGGTMNVSGGSLGTLNIASNAALNLTGGSIFLYRPLTNAGTANWLGGTVYVYNDGNKSYFGVIQNLAGALWNIQCDLSMNAGYTSSLFNNIGTVIKSVTSGTTSISVPFVNSGTLDIETGTVNFIGSSSYAQTGATVLFGVASNTISGHMGINGNLNLDGTLGINLLNGYAPKVGDSISLITYGTEGGAFQNLNLLPLSAGKVWRVAYNPTAMLLQVITNTSFSNQISGSVTDNSLQPVTNISVFAYTTNSGASLYVSAVTDGSGHYSLGVTNGSWVVGVQGLPARGYNLVANQTTVIASGNQTVNFVVQPFSGSTYTITTAPSPVGAGTATGGGTFAPGATVTVTATAITNTLPYFFSNWSENGAFESSSSSYSFSATRNRQLVANFILPSFVITATNSPAGAGNISGAGTYIYGSTNVLTATPVFGYNFTNWTEGATVVGTSPTLSTVVYSNHTFAANYIAVNITHTVTTVTAPPGLATVAGAGVYTNGQTANIIAPALVTNSPNVYTFQNLTLSNSVVSGSTNYSKILSTLDATNLQYVANYTGKAILPLLSSVTANFNSPVPSTTNFIITLRFDRTMNTAINPKVVLTNSSAAVQPNIPTNGTWTGYYFVNDTYVTPPITLSNGMDGTNQLFVSLAQSTNGGLLVTTNFTNFVVDVTAPASPVLTLTSSNSSSATVSWSGYAAPSDLNSFRVYISTTNFTAATAPAALTTLGSSARSQTYYSLALDTKYYLAVQAVDVAGNLGAFTTLAVTLPSSLPPPVVIQEAPVGASSALLSWNYNTSGLLGFNGFQVYIAQTNFSSVSGLSPVATLAASSTSYQATNLNRTNIYYFAVVGVNYTNGFNPAVTTASWSDPYAGNIGVNTTIGGAGQTVAINQSITIVSNATLTIVPGTTLLFAPGTGISAPSGSLIANGTALAPIIFDSANDTSGKTPAAGDWSGVTLGSGAGNSSLQFVEIFYGGGLTLNNCAPSVGAFTSQNNTPAGLTLLNAATLNTSSALMTGNNIGVQQFDTATLTMQNSVIQNNVSNAVALGSKTLTATSNWWGTAVLSNVTASVAGNVVVSPILTYAPLLTPAIGTSNGLTQVGSQSVNLELACRTAQSMRISEDFSFAGVFFSPFTNYTTFPLSLGGGSKHIFAQFRSVTGQTNAPVEVDVNYITAGPTISSFSLTEGATLNRPVTVTGSASAPLGMRDVEFYVDGVLQGTNAGGTFSQYFDIRTLGNAIHQVELLARDTSGNIATLQNSVIVSVTPPAAPVITQPATDFGTNINTLTVSGTAEPGIAIQLTDNGQILGTTNTDGSGHFTFANTTLIEGANSIVAVASDTIGITPSTARHINVATIPPVAVVLATPVYLPATGLTLSWQFAPTGKHATSFQIFWSASAFTATNLPASHSLVLKTMSSNVQGLTNGTYYFGIVGYDDVGNPSPLSALVTAVYDASPPVISIAYNPPPPVGVGQLGIVITSSKNLVAAPSVTIQPAGAASPILLNLTNVALNTWQSGLNIPAGLAFGTATVLAAAQDQSGNVFNGAPSGVPLVINTTPPTGKITTVPVGPVQNTNNTNVAVSLVLSEQVALGTTPTLAFAPPVGSNVTITLTGIGSNWNGTLSLASTMGSGFGKFILSAQDQASNIGTNIVSGGQLELYNTALPSAPATPTNLVATSLPGGQVKLSWNVSSNAQIYRLYREPGTNLVAPAVLDLDNLTSNSIVDLPPVDGSYRYGVTASRVGSESAISTVVIGLSDRTPPAAPTNVAVALPNSGVQVTWQEPSGNPAPDHYNIYRNGALIQTVSSIVPVTDYPPRGTNTYVVGAADVIGNESKSAGVAIQLLVGPVNNLNVLVEVGQAVVLSWVDTDSSAVGFNVYRNGIRQNVNTLVSTNFTDNFQLTDITQYSVTAVNNASQESPPRQVNVSPVGMGLLVNAAGSQTNNVLQNNYFDQYQMGISNLASSGILPLSQLQILRTVPGTTALKITQNLAAGIPAGTNITGSYIVPESPVVAAQTVQVSAFQQTDSGGSTVEYQDTFALANVQLTGTEIAVSVNQLPLAGGLTPFQVQIYNPSFVDMDLVVSRGDGATAGDVYISVLNSFGQEVSRTPFLGAPSGTTFLPDGRAYVLIHPGSSLTFTVPSVLVPAALAGSTNTTFLAVASSIYNQIGTTNESVSGPLVGSMVSSSLAVTPYYGTAHTDKSIYDNTDPVIITGQALSQATGLPVTNIALNIGFATRGYKWYQPVTTDVNGNYQYTYNPAPGFGGSLKIWAANPLVVDQLNQAQVSIYRLYDTPSTGDIQMSKNGTVNFSVTLINPGDLPLTGLSTTFSAYTLSGTNKTVITKVTGTNLSGSGLTIAPNQRQTINLQMAATIDAPSAVQVLFTFTSAEGASCTFAGNVSLFPAIPILEVAKPSVGYLEVSVNRGTQLSGQVTVANQGLTSLQGVTLVPPTNVTWMTVNLPVSGDGKIHLPDLGIGQSNTFTVVFNPPTNTPIAHYQDAIMVQGTNQSTPFSVNVYALVTSSLSGSAQFTVDDIIGDLLTNASIRLHNNILSSDVGPISTDVNGLATITNLEEGVWNWQVTAPGCTTSAGTITVVPDQTIAQHVRLNRSLVTINFTVVPVPFTDTYTIQVNQTYQTFVPLPVMVLNPTFQEFHNVKPGFNATFNVTVQNLGLVQMTDLKIAPAQNGTSFATPLITYLPLLLPMQSVDIPFTVSYLGTNAPVRQDGGGGCSSPDSTLGDAFESDLNDAFRGMGVCPQDATPVQIANAVNTAMWEFGSGTDGSFTPDELAFVQCVVSSDTGGGSSDFFGGDGFNGDGGDGGPDQGDEPWIGWPSSGAGDGCFAGNTLVLLADGTSKAISQIKANDVVRSGEHAGNISVVKNLISLNSTNVHTLQLMGAGNQKLPELIVTEEHLVWVDGKGWLPVKSVNVGDWLFNSKGARVQVTANEAKPGALRVYTLKLTGDVAFYADDVLVHDLCGPPPPMTMAKASEVVK